MDPLVSVSLPCFDCRAHLGRALASLLAQTYESWECLFVDDGSGDRPEEVLERAADPRIRAYRLPENAGRGAARQFALERARGEYHCMLDADDWLYPRRIERQLALFRRAPELDLVGAAVAVIDIEGRLTGIRRRGPEHSEPQIRGPLTRLYRMPVGHASSMVRMEAARRAGYDPAYRRFEDKEFLLKILATGRFAVAPRPLYAYRERTRPDLAAVRDSLRSARSVYGRHRRLLGGSYPAARAMLAAREWIYRGGTALGLGGWLVSRRSKPPTPAERAEFEEARRAVDAIDRARFEESGPAAAGPASSML